MIKKYLRKKLINSLTKYLDIPTTKDFLVVRNGNVYYRGKKKDDGFKRTISENAEALERSIIYKCMTNELRDNAQNTIYHKAKTMEDQIVAKTIIYTLQQMDQKLKDLIEIK